jgi:hypothetical protein
MMQFVYSPILQAQAGESIVSGWRISQCAELLLLICPDLGISMSKLAGDWRSILINAQSHPSQRILTSNILDRQ